MASTDQLNSGPLGTTNLSATTTSSTGGPQQNSTFNGVQYNALSRSEQDMIVNVTREYPFHYATIMFGYIMPFVLILTLITNTLVVMVLAQRHMRTPTNIVLFTMAIVDLMTLLSPSPWYFYIYTLGYHDKFLYPPVACYAHYIMTDVVPVFFHTSSIWLALLLAGQRYIYVCHPTLASTWCTVPRVRKAIIIILVTAFSHQITKFFDNAFVSVLVEYNESYHLACKNEISDWVTRLNVAAYYTTYFTFRILFVFIIPCVALITLNCLLFRALRRADDKRTELLRTKFRLIGTGNRSSIGNAENVKQYSFTGNNNGCLTTDIGTGGIVSRLSMTIGRRSPSSIDQFNVGRPRKSSSKNNSNSKTNSNQRNEHQDKQRKKFSMSSFQMKRRRNKNTLVSTNPNPGNMVVSSPNNQNSDIKLSSSVLDDHRSATNTSNDRGDDSVRNDNGCGSVSGDYSLKGRISLIRGGEGEESNDSCSITTYLSNREHNNNICRHQNNNKQLSSRSKSLIRDNHKRNNERRRSLDEEEGGDIQSTGREEEDYTCVDCVACQQNVESECQHCSAAANGGATIVSRLRHGQPLNRTVSQCSSLVGGATNTTTNDDASSCMVTQNASLSMFVVHDGTLDATEATSMKEEDGIYGEEGDDGGGNCGGDEDEEAEYDEEALVISLHNNDGSRLLKESITNTTTNNNKSSSNVRKSQRNTHSLTKSDSVDSRLVCGCLSSSSSANRPVRAPSRGRSSSTRLKHECRECCLANDCRSAAAIISHGRFIIGSELAGGKKNSKPSKCVTSACSSSEPCINCNNSLRPGISKNLGCTLSAAGDDNNDDDEDGSNGGINGNGDRVRRAKARLPTSQSDYAGEGVREEIKSIVAGNAIAITTTTTTTTTTLYSNNANSIGSLLQVQNQANPATATTTATSVKAAKRYGSQMSPSFASSTGRGSRATLMGGSNPPPMIAGGGNFVAASTPASIRTMDSNRTTLMLIVVVTVFLMVEVPVAIVTILHVVLNSFDVFKDVEFGVSLNYIKLFTNFFIMISYSVNFTIYCSMSKKFRETFRDLFMCGKRAKRKRAHRLLYQQQRHSQCPQTQLNFNQDNPTTQGPNNDNNNSTSNATYRRASSQQQECEL